MVLVQSSVLERSRMARSSWHRVFELLPFSSAVAASSHATLTSKGGNFLPAPAPAASAPESSFPDINIAGLGTVLDKSAPPFRRVMWSGILAVCSAVMIYHTWKRIELYLTDTVSTNTEYIRNDTLIFPSLTLCPYRNYLVDDAMHLNETKVRRLYNEHFASASFVSATDAMYRLADVYDVQTLWMLAARDLSKEIAHGKWNCSDVVRTSEVLTVLGVCLHFDPPPISFGGSYHGFSLELKGGEGRSKMKYYLMISDAEDTVDIHSLTHGVYVESGWNKDVSISLKMFQRQSTGARPCSPDANRTTSRCISRCFHRALVNQSGCRMPYMNLGGLEPVAYCNGSGQLRGAEELVHGMLSQGIGWNPSGCDCHKTTCSHQHYEWFLDTYKGQENGASYKVFYGDTGYEQTTEDFDYDFLFLLCDIGGILGFYLGLSVLTMVQVADASWRHLASSLSKYNGRREADRSRGSENIRVIRITPADATPAIQH